MKLLALDGNSLLNRAYYGLRPLSTREGIFTHAVYGFMLSFLKLMEDETPDAVCVVFDLRAPTFRHALYPEYKAHRKPMPEELAMQIPLLKGLLDALRVTRFELATFEGDDLLGTISAQHPDTVLVSGDRDLLQLAGNGTRVRLVSAKGGKTEYTEYTPEHFTAEYGFAPALLIDAKGLQGDASDNLPGVAGIGEKTARQLVAEYGGLEAIYAAVDAGKIKETLAAKLRAGKEMAFLTRDLATIRRNAPMAFDIAACLRREPEQEKLRALLLKLEFQSLLNRFDLAEKEDSEAPPLKILREFTVSGAGAEQELAALCRRAEHVYLAFDGAWGTLALHADDWIATLDARKNIPFTAFLFSSAVRKVAHDVKSLMTRLLEMNIPAEGFVFDTALGAYLLNPARNDYALSADPAPAARALAVAALYRDTLPELRARGQEALLREIELPLCPVLARMEHTGIRIDRPRLVQFGAGLETRIAAVRQRVFELAGEEFNIASPKQLGELLFEKLGLKTDRKTKTGYSTDIDVLQKLRAYHPVVDAVIEYRQLAKLHSTYVEGLLNVIAPDGKIHTRFNMTATATGRLSSADPNLQNIPIRTELGGELRTMFIPSAPGRILIDADYSQIELRLLAHIAGDTAMQEAFRRGEDIHAFTASQVFEVPLAEVTREMRRRAKAVNFGIVYGISAFALAEDLGISRKEAEHYIAEYFEKYSAVRNYMTRVVEESREQGFVQTLFGRRRYLPELKSPNFQVRSFGERVALNMPIQGTAADLMKLSMIRVAGRLRRENLDAELLLQVHDELLLDADPAQESAVRRVLTEEMENVAPLSVPLTTDISSGKTWLDAK